MDLTLGICENLFVETAFLLFCDTDVPSSFSANYLMSGVGVIT